MSYLSDYLGRRRDDDRERREAEARQDDAEACRKLLGPGDCYWCGKPDSPRASAYAPRLCPRCREIWKAIVNGSAQGRAAFLRRFPKLGERLTRKSIDATWTEGGP
jgi:hypothetical protein